jgi:predicted Abi (CAAX) family protease
VLHTLAARLQTAILTLPNAEAWLFSAILILILAMISLPMGLYLGFLQIDILKTSRLKIGAIIATAFLTPAVSEELFFRALLLPHPSEGASISAQWLWGCISLAIFIIYHPLNAISFFPAGLKTFFDPVFLLLAGFLGIACTLAYLQSGSLWMPIIHWVVVVVWLLFLGGYGKLNPVQK